MSASSNSYCKRIASFDDWHQRLKDVSIFNEDALTIINEYDSKDTFFYLDPPYTNDSRVDLNVYKHDTDESFHLELMDILLTLKGKFLLSGYNTPIYQPLTDNGWNKVEINTACYAATRGRGSKLRGLGSALKHASRTEVLWMNYGQGKGML